MTNSTYKLFTPDAAEKMAALMNGDDWKFVVVHDPKGTGFSYIEMYDEDGNYVGRM